MAAIKFGPQLKELRILLCQTSKSSQGVRDFIEQQYVPLKRSNPKFPVLIRECSDTEPVLYARYDYENEERIIWLEVEANNFFTGKQYSTQQNNEFDGSNVFSNTKFDIQSWKEMFTDILY
ncbi:NADH dehydrogenase [ubiquinone] 1 alpha subcomplex subunit 2 isoform X1 [Bombus pascuorum]|uniref:NADH dehydrogenase [ubiquinone] 1 alpha subcomplex subunit 2 isoform X1 n=1 Tax=Bombus pascuorum TaxID=65598 RepID=UPI00298EB43E|nr:NADH dehydrogenase [ubiquinone] 1 alpha subcomplex subunit 2 isoform X1 [Bombus pascuorum]